MQATPISVVPFHLRRGGAPDAGRSALKGGRPCEQLYLVIASW
jgi:hypothetical protein